MQSYQKRQRRADQLAKAMGFFFVVSIAFVLLLQTTFLSVVPFPKTLSFRGDPQAFVGCFEQYSKFAQTDGVTLYARQLTQPENRIWLSQLRGLVRLSSARGLYIDLDGDKFTLVDWYYENREAAKARPIRKYDWGIAWLCGTGNI
mgnify:CR=1 FL=1